MRPRASHVVLLPNRVAVSPGSVRDDGCSPQASGIRRPTETVLYGLVRQCPKCHGRLRVLAVTTEREPLTRILSHLALPTRAPPLARARDPSDEVDDIEPPAQLELGLA